MGNVIKAIRSRGYDYWAAYVGGEKKIKIEGLNPIPTGLGHVTLI